VNLTKHPVSQQFAVLRGLLATVGPAQLLWVLLQRLPDVAELSNQGNRPGTAR